MIQLHRLGRTPQPFHLNPDLIVTVEANPDTHVHLATGTSLLVCESPEEVAAEVRAWRRSISPITALAPTSRNSS